MSAGEIRKLLLRVVAGIFITDVLLIILHLTTHASIINLEEEQNISTWYSSMKLLLLALLCVASYFTEKTAATVKGKQPFPFPFLWLACAAIFLYLSMDETGTVHERVAGALMKTGMGGEIRETVFEGDSLKDRFSWVIFLAPPMIAVIFFFAFFFLSRFKKNIPLYLASLLGVALFTASPVLEVLEVYFTPALSNWTASEKTAYGVLTSIEESSELLGTSFFILAMQSYLAHLIIKKHE